MVVINYKMKLELGMHAREVQRDWYGKRGISLHGFYVIARVAPGERQIEVLDLWSEDTKQDAWFTQSALGVGFEWMEKVFPNLYLFSGKLFLCISSYCQKPESQLSKFAKASQFSALRVLFPSKL